MVLLVWLGACGALQGACEGLGFDGACTEPLTPLPGPWVADPGPAAVCGLDGSALADGWTVDSADAGFVLTPPEGDAVDCALDGAAFTCAAGAGPSGSTITASGSLGSRSTADLQLHVAADACAVDVPAPFVAAWKAVGPEPGTCPRKYDDYDSDPDQPQVGFSVQNLSGATLGLYAISGGSDVYVNPVEAGATVQSMTTRNGWMALATDFGSANCVYFFQVRDDGQIEAYTGN